MIESPVLQELKEEWTREAAREAALQTRRRTIVELLSARFGPQAEDFAARLDTVSDEARLKELVQLAALCPELQTFRNELQE